MNFFKKKDHEGNMALDTEEDLSVSGQLRKIIEHLAFLEKKLDTLLEQSGQRRSGPPRFGNRGFSRPGRDYRGGHSGPMGHSGHSSPMGHSGMGHSGHSDRPMSGGYRPKFAGGHGHGRPSHGPRRGGFPKRHHSSEHANPGNQL